VEATTLEEGNYLYLSGVILVIFDPWNPISAVSPFWSKRRRRCV